MALNDIKVYFDTNQFVRIFERESKTLFPKVKAMVEKNNWKIVVSEGNILEVFLGIGQGARINKIQEGLNLLQSLNPIWFFAAGLDSKELTKAFTQYQRGKIAEVINPFLNWTSFLLTLFGKINVPIPVLNTSIFDVFHDLYSKNLLTRDNKDTYWQSELSDASRKFRASNDGKDKNIANKNHFIGIVTDVCRKLSRDKDTLYNFANFLIDNPQICPGFRLNFEVTVLLLCDNQSRWTTNRFFDQRHIMSVPYVDLYVGLDRGQNHAILEFDKHIGRNVSISYQKRCFNRIEDVMQ